MTHISKTEANIFNFLKFILLFCFTISKELRKSSKRLNQTISNETSIIDEVFKLYPQFISTTSANQRLASATRQSTDQIHGNVSEVLQILAQQNTTMLLWDQVDILRNRSNEILKMKQNTSQIIDYTSEKGNKPCSRYMDSLCLKAFKFKLFLFYFTCFFFSLIPQA